jgi:hypothetical protein
LFIKNNQTFSEKKSVYLSIIQNVDTITASVGNKQARPEMKLALNDKNIYVT